MTASRPRLGWAIAAIWVSVALATLIAAAFISYLGAVNAPRVDEWYYTNPTEYLASLFHKHNEHPFAIGRIFLALDYWLFDAQGWSLRLGTFLSLGIAVWAVVVLGRIAGVTALRDRIILCAFAIVVIFNPQGYQNLVAGFQFTFVLAFTASAAAFAALANYAARPSPPWLSLSYASGFIATQSLANGLLAPPLLLMVALRLKLPRNVLAGFATLTIVSWGAFFLMPGRVATYSIQLDHWPAMVLYGLSVLGSGPATTLASLQVIGGPGLAAPLCAAFFGIIILGAALLLGAVSVFADRPNPGRLSAAALAALAIGSAALIGLSRSALGPDSALSSRYTLISAIAIAAVAILAASYFPKARPRFGDAVLLAGAIVVALAPMASVPLAASVAERQRVRVGAQTAFVVGITDRTQALTYMPYGPPDAPRRAADLKTHGKSLFRDRWSRAMGQRIDASEVGDHTCRGVLAFKARTIRRGYVRLQGEVEAASTARGRIIVVVNEAGLMAGYGLVPRRPSDFLWMSTRQSEPLDWGGYARARPRDIGARYTAYLASADRLLCRIDSATLQRGGA